MAGGRGVKTTVTSEARNLGPNSVECHIQETQERKRAAMGARTNLEDSQRELREEGVQNCGKQYIYEVMETELREDCNSKTDLEGKVMLTEHVAAALAKGWSFAPESICA